MPSAKHNVEAHIYEASQADAAILAKIHAECFPDDPWSEASILSLLSQKHTFALLINSDNITAEPKGFIILQCVVDEAEIITIGITPNQCRTGLATMLLLKSIEYLKTNNFKTLHLEVSENNIAALALYSHAGFHKTGVRKGYYKNSQGNSINAITLQLSL